jgi:hypothetical protein
LRALGQTAGNGPETQAGNFGKGRTGTVLPRQG